MGLDQLPGTSSIMRMRLPMPVQMLEFERRRKGKCPNHINWTPPSKSGKLLPIATLPLCEHWISSRQNCGQCHYPTCRWIASAFCKIWALLLKRVSWEQGSSEQQLAAEVAGEAVAVAASEAEAAAGAAVRAREAVVAVPAAAAPVCSVAFAVAKVEDVAAAAAAKAVAAGPRY